MNTNATTVRVRGPQDLIAFVPFRLGYQPSESVVVVSVRGARQLVGLVARLDLDAFDGRCADGRPATEVAAESLARVATKDGADRVVVVGYTGTALPAAVDAATRVRRAMEATAARIEARLPGTESWVVTPGGYRALDCTDTLCCPAEGRPVDDIVHSRIAATMVLAGRTVAPSRADRLRIARASPEARRSAGRAAGRWATARATTAEWAARSLEEWRVAVRRAGAAEPGESVEPEPAVLGRLAAAMGDRWVRDALLMWITADEGTADDDVVLRTAQGRVDAETDAAAGRAMARIVDPDGAARPADERVGPAVHILEAVVAHVPRARQPAPLTLLGLIAWWGGDGAVASGRLAAALAIDADYSLARLVSTALEAGLPPGWVRRETAELERERAREEALADRPGDTPGAAVSGERSGGVPGPVFG
ncbi:DUF4192 domain-containing protein [Myceligenerans pegani]|uniref:DUF4192 domain-containing protein n=1 Tax=Myceligenerans pegani TaxID=2776917 RepID=A0ABR9N0R6_9MICO|nr:DUF4192 domain-containing protein [Myceligenerans sp. TRM 65318]MBE1877243.1 DUF4192 domain-containing protein [Myceligenerans sp. TRM 65318]MBE3019514.1 DUF4192 domain-containing protein [Myceligenerans sp. TRM 65318]